MLLDIQFVSLSLPSDVLQIKNEAGANSQWSLSSIKIMEEPVDDREGFCTSEEKSDARLSLNKELFFQLKTMLKTTKRHRKFRLGFSVGIAVLFFSKAIIIVGFLYFLSDAAVFLGNHTPVFIENALGNFAEDALVEDPKDIQQNVK